MAEGRCVASTDIHLLKVAGSLNGRSVHNDKTLSYQGTYPFKTSSWLPLFYAIF